MANNPFDRVVINTRERPLSSDINQAESQIERTLREVIDRLMLARASISDDRSLPLPITGFIGEAFKIRPASPLALQVTVSPGVGFFVDDVDKPSAIGGVAGVDDLSRWKPMLLQTTPVITIPAPDPTNPRIDIVEVRHNRRLADAASRDVLDPGTGVFVPTSVQKTLAWDVGSSISVVTTPASSTGAIGYKAGTPSAVPAAPPVTPGYIKIAEVQVGNAVTTIDADKIVDLRHMLAPFGFMAVAARANLDITPVVSLSRLAAPPGVVVVANVSGGTRRLYVFAGDVSLASPIAQASRVTAAAASVDATVITVDATLQTNLQNAAQSDPATKVAVGQSGVRIDVGNANDTYNISCRL